MIRKVDICTFFPICFRYTNELRKRGLISTRRDLDVRLSDVIAKLAVVLSLRILSTWTRWLTYTIFENRKLPITLSYTCRLWSDFLFFFLNTVYKRLVQFSKSFVYALKKQTWSKVGFCVLWKDTGFRCMYMVHW